ncbi:MAG: winged helix-turn-helix domain-containing protein [Candidatus Brocadiia bacterium]
MNDPVKPEEIDPIIHERARLAIVSALAVTPEMPFTELKEQLDLTDGNLSAHAAKLEDAGYIEIKKSFQDKRPRTTMRLTSRGRKAFKRYLQTLSRIVEPDQDESSQKGK